MYDPHAVQWDDEIVDLSVLRVRQHRAAVAADVIHSVSAGD
jgi:hypothetical protein